MASLVSGAKRFLRYVITLLFLFYYGFLLFYMKSGNYEPLYIDKSKVATLPRLSRKLLTLFLILYVAELRVWFSWHFCLPQGTLHYTRICK
jgi:hypothetical protein